MQEQWLQPQPNMGKKKQGAKGSKIIKGTMNKSKTTSPCIDICMTTAKNYSVAQLSKTTAEQPAPADDDSCRGTKSTDDMHV